MNTIEVSAAKEPDISRGSWWRNRVKRELIYTYICQVNQQLFFEQAYHMILNEVLKHMLLTGEVRLILKFSVDIQDKVKVQRYQRVKTGYGLKRVHAHVLLC